MEDISQVAGGQPPSIWTTEKVDQLKGLWQEGLSTAEIGRRLGITKNAVVGKAHRMNLPARPSPVKRRSEPRIMAPQPPQPQIAMTPMPAPPNFVGPKCQWPIGHPREPGFRFCGAPSAQGRPYCPAHASIAYRPANVKEEAA
ncbi:MAG: global cell cycle regulator GcrA-like protein [Alphaproteobacteria bacterium]|nr:global cell cycle regulator GcrA-like protein [Alphaproteobacteria bacterium]